MPLREDQVIVQRVLGAVEVVAQVLGQEDGHQVGRGHRRGRVAGACCGGRADRVDAQLLAQLAPLFLLVHRGSSSGGDECRGGARRRRHSSPRRARVPTVGKRPDQRDGPAWKPHTGPERSRTYREAMTLFSVFLIAVLRRPSVTTTAIVITPRTTAYSAMVWPASSRTSARNSLIGLTSPKCSMGKSYIPSFRRPESRSRSPYR